jgi:ADP-heptose:LPS heptosyltransferase
MEHHEGIIEDAVGARIRSVAGTTDLVQLCALIASADLVISCDTAAVHLAAAYRRPQIALFGPTNPFHWRPRHDRAMVISAAQPEEPMKEFNSRMKGGTMDRISTATVCRAIDTLLAS